MVKAIKGIEVYHLRTNKLTATDASKANLRQAWLKN
jgi:hypothetical protein